MSRNDGRFGWKRRGSLGRTTSDIFEGGAGTAAGFLVDAGAVVSVDVGIDVDCEVGGCEAGTCDVEVCCDTTVDVDFETTVVVSARVVAGTTVAGVEIGFGGAVIRTSSSLFAGVPTVDLVHTSATVAVPSSLFCGVGETDTEGGSDDSEELPRILFGS